MYIKVAWETLKFLSQFCNVNWLPPLPTLLFFFLFFFTSVTNIPSRAACSACYYTLFITIISYRVGCWSCGASGGAVGMIMYCGGGSSGQYHDLTCTKF